MAPLLHLSTPEVALLLVALQYAVLAPGWLVAGTLLPDERRATTWWAGYAVASALGLTLIVLGMHLVHPGLRAAGNLGVVLATVAMQRGIWAFTGQAGRPGLQYAVLAVTAVMAWLGMAPEWAPARVAVISALWSGLYLWAARDVWRCVRAELQLRWPLLVVSPMLATAAMLVLRAARALQSPDTVVHEVSSGTVLNLGSSVTGLVAALVLQLMLAGLLVTRLVQRLARSSRHDALTGLLNRRAFDDLLAGESQRAERLAGRLAVMMVDIDHFKRLNDTQGHAAGDRALQQVAQALAAGLREIDHLARWGGEEFAALLPDTDLTEAVALAERLCDHLRAQALAGAGPALTVSVGVAAWRGAGDSAAAMLARADRALYAAKHAGRDAVRA